MIKTNNCQFNIEKYRRTINFINKGKGVSKCKSLPSKNLFRLSISDKDARVGLAGLSARNTVEPGDRSVKVDMFLFKYFHNFPHLSTSFSE